MGAPAPAVQDQENDSDSADEPIDLRDPTETGAASNPTSAGTGSGSVAIDTLTGVPTELVADIYDVPTELVADMVMAASEASDVVDPSTVEINGTKISDMKTLQLRMELKRRGKPFSGRRDELAEALAVAVAFEKATLLLHD